MLETIRFFRTEIKFISVLALGAFISLLFFGIKFTDEPISNLIKSSAGITAMTVIAGIVTANLAVRGTYFLKGILRK